GAVLLVAALGVAVLAVLDLSLRALALVADRKAGLDRDLVAPGFFPPVVEDLDADHALPRMRRDHDLGLLGANALPPDRDAEQPEYQQHERPSPPAAGRPGLRGLRGLGCLRGLVGDP